MLSIAISTFPWPEIITIGVSGLSKNINLMRQGEIQTFNTLLKKNLINKILYKILLIYSFIKQKRRGIFYYGNN